MTFGQLSESGESSLLDTLLAW